MRYLWLIFLIHTLVLAGCSRSSDVGAGGGTTPSCTPTPTAGSLTLFGTVRYEDVEYNEFGWTGNSYFKPVRNAFVDLLDGCGNTLISGATDNGGAFLFSNVTLAAKPVTIRVMAESDPASGSSVAVSSTGGAGYAATYSLLGADLAMPQSIDISQTSGLGGVFNMLDVYQSAMEFVASHPSAPALPQLNVFWKNTLGSYTCDGYLALDCPQGMGIYVLNIISNYYTDQDEYDDDVLWHEFSHFVEYALKVSDSPGGMHRFDDNTLDLTLAWSEGNADYLQTAIKRWLRANHPERISIPAAMAESWYIDTDTQGQQLIKLDMANPDISLCKVVGVDCYVYATSEVAVAKIAWEINTTLGEYSVWSAWLGDWWSPNPQYRAHSLELFWDGLLYAGGLTSGQIYPLFSGRSVNYASDGFELQNDGALNGRAVVDCTKKGTTCLNEFHTHYLPGLVADLDIVPISVTAGVTYTIKTQQLTNGADTKLRLLDGNGQVLLNGGGVPLVSDDIPSLDCDPDPYVVNYCNNGINFSSQLLYTPSTSGTVYVEVSNADFALNIAGAYGGYALTIFTN